MRSLSRLRNQLYIIIFTTDTVAGRQFNLLLDAVILGSVLLAIIETIPQVSQQFKTTFSILEWGVTLLFTLEYICRIYASRKPLKYIFSFYGLIDLIATLPTYLRFFWSGIPPLQVLRILRLMRVFRILKLIQFSDEATALGLALKASSRKIIVFLSAVLVLVIIIGSFMYVIESETSGFTNIPQSIYWTIVTLTTVGYGDIAPQTPLGKFLASVIMLLGYGIIAIPTGIVAIDVSQVQKMKRGLKVCPDCSYQEEDNKAQYCKYCGKLLISNGELRMEN